MLRKLRFRQKKFKKQNKKTKNNQNKKQKPKTMVFLLKECPTAKRLS